MRKIEAAGISFDSLLNFPLNAQRPSVIKNSFNQMLGASLKNNSLSVLSDTSKEDEGANDTLSLLNTDNLLIIDNGKELLNQLQSTQKSSTETLQMIKDFLGISDQKWASIMEDSNGKIELKNDGTDDVLGELKSYLFRLNKEQLQSGLNENQTLILKAAKLYDLLSANNDASQNQSSLAAALQTVKDKLVAAEAINDKKEKQQHDASLLTVIQVLVHPENNIPRKNSAATAKTLIPKKNPQKLSDMLTLLNVDNLFQLSGGKQMLSQIQSDPQASTLQVVKNYLGISNQKWAEIIAELISNTKGADRAQSITNHSASISDFGSIQSLSEIQQDPLQILKDAFTISDQNGSDILKKLNISTTRQADAGNTTKATEFSGKSQQQSALPPESLETIKNVLGVSDPKWIEELKLSNSSSNLNAFNNQDLMTAIVTKLSRLDSGQLLPLLNDNTQTFLNAIKLYDLLNPKNDKVNDKQNLTAQLELIKEKLEVITPINSQIVKGQNSGSLFSKSGSISDKQSTDPEGISNLNEKMPLYNTQQFEFHPMTKTQQLSIMLNPSQKSTPMEGMMQQFESILSKSHFSKADGAQKLFVKLNPEHLGSLRIELIQKDQAIVAKILTSSQTAKDILENNLNSLKDSFLAQNIHVDKLEITANSPTQTQPDQLLKRDQQNQQQHGHNFEEQNQNSQQDEESENNFTLSLEKELFNMKA